jgi:hypothetical protein
MQEMDLIGQESAGNLDLATNECTEHFSECGLEDSNSTCRPDQSRLRRKILGIQSSSLSAAEKAKAIQQLMCASYNTTKKSPVAVACHSNYHDESQGIFGCRHYRRNCKLQAHCCGEWYVCRFCHDESNDHTITRLY